MATAIMQIIIWVVVMTCMTNVEVAFGHRSCHAWNISYVNMVNSSFPAVVPLSMAHCSALGRPPSQTKSSAAVTAGRFVGSGVGLLAVQLGSKLIG